MKGLRPRRANRKAGWIWRCILYLCGRGVRGALMPYTGTTGGRRGEIVKKAITKRNNTNEKKEVTMIWTIFVILLILWLFGLVSSYTMGGFIHILLVVAVIVLVVGLFQRR